MKILCLHGIRHNVDVLKKNMKKLIEKYKRYDIEFEFFESPIRYINENTNNFDNNSCDNYFQWWSSTRETFLIDKCYDTINESLLNLKQKWMSDNYDGLLGFSQGSVLSQIFVCQINKKIIDTYLPKFMILANPYPITDNNFVDYNDHIKNITSMKTIIICGTRDPLISIDIPINLMKNFNDANILIHSGGHFMSSATEIMYPLLKILQRFI